MRSVLIACIAMTSALPATAQMNPAAIGGGLVMPSAINAQENSLMHRRSSGPSRSARGYDPEGAAYCANLPGYRRELGAHHPNIVTLERLCREHGFATR